MPRGSGYITTHVLDTARGLPAADLEIDLYWIAGDRRTHLRYLTNNSDGRTDQHVVPSDEFSTGVYELVFNVGA